MSNQQAKRSMVISLIGRPNVGKSSLFNRLMRKGHKAITHDLPGVTRDRHYGIAELDELQREVPQQVILVDTGGFYPTKIEPLTGKSEEAFNSKFFNIMTEQAKMAIQESDLVLFVADVREGILPFDLAIAESLRSFRKDFWVLANKWDTQKQMGEEAEFYQLGIDEDQLFTTSAEHGLGLSELREALHRKALEFEKLNPLELSETSLHKGVTPREDVVARLAIIGAPNAGKSTLLNALLGSDRALVSDIPGTTVDPIEGFFDLYFGHDAKFLNEKHELSMNDGLLLKQYEEFRRNNPDVFEALQESYNQEELAHGDNPEADLLDNEEDLFYGEGVVEENDDSAEMLAKLDSEEDFQTEAEERLMHQAFEQDLLDESEELDATAIEEQVAVESELAGSYWRSLHLVDTAGIRRQKSITGFVESQSVYRSLRCITESDIVVFMVDATQGIGHQDRRLMDITLEKGKSLVLCLNKMDLVRNQLKTPQERKLWLEGLRDEVPWLDFVDIIPLSAKYLQGLNHLKKVLAKTVLIRRRPIATGELNRFVMELIERHPITAKKSNGKRFKVKYTSMIKADPPTFLLFTNKSKGIPDNYRRYLKNGLRQAFTLDNTPIHLIFRTGHDLNARMKKVKFSPEA